MEAGKMLCLVPPSSLAELQSLRAEDGDQTSKKTHGKCDASCQVKIFSFFISAFVLSILPVFSISIVPRVVGIKNKTPAWDTCVAILTRFLLHPPWLPLPSKDVTGLICFPLLLGLLYLQNYSLSKAFSPHLLSEDAMQDDTNLSPCPLLS